MGNQPDEWFEKQIIRRAEHIDTDMLQEFIDRLAQLNAISLRNRYLDRHRDAAVAALKIGDAAHARLSAGLKDTHEEEQLDCLDALASLCRAKEREMQKFRLLKDEAEGISMPKESGWEHDPHISIDCTRELENIRAIDRLKTRLSKDLYQMADRAYVITHREQSRGKTDGPSR